MRGLRCCPWCGSLAHAVTSQERRVIAASHQEDQRSVQKRWVLTRLAVFAVAVAVQRRIELLVLLRRPQMLLFAQTPRLAYSSICYRSCEYQRRLDHWRLLTVPNRLARPLTQKTSNRARRLLTTAVWLKVMRQRRGWRPGPHR